MRNSTIVFAFISRAFYFQLNFFFVIFVFFCAQQNKRLEKVNDFSDSRLKYVNKFDFVLK